MILLGPHRRPTVEQLQRTIAYSRANQLADTIHWIPLHWHCTFTFGTTPTTSVTRRTSCTTTISGTATVHNALLSTLHYNLLVSYPVPLHYTVSLQYGSLAPIRPQTARK